MNKVEQKYIVNGHEVDIYVRGEGVEKDQLPVGVYRLCFAPMRGWYFTTMEDFTLPSKLYGNIVKRADRILATYNKRLERGKSTGILLSGMKGGGKTLLAKKIAIDSNLPVILINTPFNNDSFKELIAQLGPVVILFDEFEKVYENRDAQNGMLTLFDGVFENQALSIVIVNETHRLVDALMNRPGRLYYRLDYGGLDDAFIREYAMDRLEDPSQERVNGILSIATFFSAFTFDHLQAVVEEMNRWGESAKEAVEWLNVRIPQPSSFERYNARIWHGDNEITDIQSPNSLTTSNNPVTRGINMHVYLKDPHINDGKPEDKHIYIPYEYVSCNQDTLADVDVDSGVFTFYDQNNDIRVSFKKDTSYSYSSTMTGGRRRSVRRDLDDDDGLIDAMNYLE